jgi:hypothetical protein
MRTRLVMLAATVFLVAGCQSERRDKEASARSDASGAALPEIDSGAPAEVDASLFTSAKNFPYPFDGVVIGQGWDSFSEGGTQAQCVDVVEVAIESTAFNTSVEQIKSTYGLLKEQSVKASVSGSYGAYSGSASAEASRSQKLETDFENILFSFVASVGSTRAVGVSPAMSASSPRISADEKAKGAVAGVAAAESPVRFGGAIRLTDDAVALLKSGDGAKFQRVCGDGFVAAIHRGSRVRVLATLQSRSTAEKADFVATVKAGGFGVSGSVSAGQKKDINAFNAQTRFTISQEGGTPIAAPGKLDDLKNLFAKTDSFTSNPGAYQVTMVPYVALTNYPSDIRLESPARLKRLGDYYLVLSDVYQLASDALNYALTPSPGSPYAPRMIEAYGGVPHLRLLKDTIHSDLKLLEEGITDCYRNRSGCSEVHVKKEAAADAKREVDTGLAIAKQLEQQLKEARELHSKGDVSGSAGALKLQSTEPLAAEALPQLLQQRKAEIDALKASLAEAEDLTGVLGHPATVIDDAFFLRFYQYLIEVPLANEYFKLELNPSQAQDAKTIDDTLGAFRTALLTNRLLPWKEYFCRESMSAPLCVYDEELQALLEDAELGFIGKTVRVLMPYQNCKYYLGGREISEAQYVSYRKSARLRRKTDRKCTTEYR